MKNILFKILMTAFLFLNGFMAFAAPGDEDTGGDLEGNDPPVAPIDSKLIILAVIGIIYAVYIFKNNRKTA